MHGGENMSSGKRNKPGNEKRQHTHARPAETGELEKTVFTQLGFKTTMAILEHR